MLIQTRLYGNMNLSGGIKILKQNRQHIDSYCNHYPYFRKIHDKVVSVGHFGSGFDLLLRDGLLAIADVLCDGGGK